MALKASVRYESPDKILYFHAMHILLRQVMDNDDFPFITKGVRFGVYTGSDLTVRCN